MRLSAILSPHTLLHILPLVASLNILISSADSWVDKNARYLYPALKKAGHNVVYVGPLHSHPYTSPIEEDDDSEALQSISYNDYDFISLDENGAFDHLKNSHQKYFKYLRKLNAVNRGAKNVISKRESAEYDTQHTEKISDLVRNRAYGQDPLNPDFWYVNGTPLEALAVAFDTILADHVTSFKPDLVLIGPNEGIHLTCDSKKDVSIIAITDLLNMPDQVEAMRLLVQIHDYPVIAVSTEDAHHIYYEDEDFFNVEESSYQNMFKSNFVSQNIQFVNSRLLELIPKVMPHLKKGSALNVNFPSMNRRSSTCTTSKTHGPKFLRVSRTTRNNSMGSLFVVPQYSITKDSISLEETRLYKASDTLQSVEQVSRLEQSRLQSLISINNVESHEYPKGGTKSVYGEPEYSNNEDLNEIYCNAAEYRAMQQCSIAVSVHNLKSGGNLDESVLDLSSYIY